MAVDPDEKTQFQVGTSPSEPGVAPAGIPRPGDVIAEKYRVESILGAGGMGVVLAVRHMQLGEPYAIKCLLPGGAADPEIVERFMREARAAVRIKSEHIARVSDVGKLENGAPYILMEHLIGRDLSDVLSEYGVLSITDAVEYVLQACTGIAEAHALGIVHRDLKPANLFLTQRRDGPSLVKVLDFGISKAIGDGGPHNPSLTQTSSVFGSPAYMSPEQIRSAKNVDYRTDVWALGVILYELLTGKSPFTAETSGGLLSAIAADEPHSLRERRADVPPELEAVVMRCLEKKVAQRFQSVSELATALEPFASSKSLVSVGRIRRLSAAPSDPLPQLSTGNVSSRSAPVDAALTGMGTATEKAWTTGAANPAKAKTKSRAIYVLAVLSLLAAAGVAALYVSRTSGKPAAQASTAAPPPPVVSTEPPASTTASATNAASDPPPATSVAGSPRGAGSARPLPGGRSGRPRVGTSPAPFPSAGITGNTGNTSAGNAVAPPPPAPPPPTAATPPAGAPRLDPTAESH